MSDLVKKTVVITGATSGIGKLLVFSFANAGYTVFAGYRNEKLKEKLEKISDNVVPFYIDMAKKETILEAVSFIIERVEHIDTVINAAGCVVAGAMECLDTDKIRTQFDINTFSHLELVQGLLPKMLNSKIINISSMASFGIFPFISPYCASKRALDILFNSLQLELKNKGIKIISIKPGVVKTPLWDKSIELNKESLNESEKYKKEFEFLAKNAQKNNHKGLEPQAVVDLIMRINDLKNPKPSYTIGLDAKCAEILSHLPQSWINFMVCKGFEHRMC